MNKKHSILERILELLIYLLIMVSSYAIPFILHRMKERPIEKKDCQEDLSNGGIDEPHSIRQLTNDEETFLLKQYNQTRQDYHLVWIVVCFALIAESTLFIFILRINLSLVIAQLIFFLIIIAIIIELAFNSGGYNFG